MTTRTKLLLLILPILLLISGCATMGNRVMEDPDDDTEQKYNRARDVESREACLTGILIASGILSVVLLFTLF